ncbi:anti-phage dCTP deaminase [Pseudomonas sp. RA_15y_Pfl2_54]|uniref:anti-phage dCTP deaminase n=1 Tax=Pseudomonas sp. RA_15y_Pfl2_54 TaxID=3088704 RepID=UPI0030DB2CFD
MRFDGEFDELKIKLLSLQNAGEWRTVNQNQHQFRANNRGIMNWYPSTGNITFQGDQNSSEQLKSLIEDLLNHQAHEEISEPGEITTETEAAVAELSADSQGPDTYFLDDSYSDSELVIGLVGTIGTNLAEVAGLIEERLLKFNYTADRIKISTDIISNLGNPSPSSDEYGRITAYMEEGNNLRKNSKDNSILALGAAARINLLRKEQEAFRRKSFIINSLKNPAEVQRLRKIYSNGFFLIGVHADHTRRHNYLTKDKSISEEQASKLIDRDADERDDYGQHTRDTYHLSDFFINYNGNSDSLKKQIWRVFDLLFGKPYITPTFDEYAMFMAFSASLRSADLSRQVGAVLTKDKCIVSTGANDVPKAHGGLYWPEIDESTQEIVDAKDGRDYMKGEDSNATQKRLIIDSILKVIPMEYREELRPLIKKSKIKDITEYGRVVHAEMEALLSSARLGISTSGSDLYCTTFPCHNCAKHIVASGIKRVIYVEPYPKSKALDFHSDSISLNQQSDNVVFAPFIGVGPRSFFNLFSTNLGSGYPVIRKSDDGQSLDWSEHDAKLRTQMLPCSYIERETIAANLLSKYLEGSQNDTN